MEYTPRGRVPVSEPISPVAQRVALSGPASEPGGAGVASSREGWPWQWLGGDWKPLRPLRRS